ncbi:MAG: hypothetical protein A3G75_01575, partial [Verrucomicrobia bacterium RIFCSPLOWO2_12_FULL_64_8]
FFPEERPVVWWAWGGRAIVFAVVAVYGWSFFRTPIRDLGDDPRFIHNVHLVFHEAGHAIFGVFGNEFLQFAGGTLGQLLMPVVLLVAFRWKNRDAFGAALAAWMLGQSLVDCAPYINDARTLGLTLVGGHTGQEVEGHDWEYLLTHLNLLHKDVFIAHYVLLAGRWVMALSLLWAALELGRQFQRLGGGAASGGCDRL